MSDSEGENSTDDGDCYSPYDSSDYTIVAAISTSLGILSFLACVFMIVIIVLYKKYLFFTQRLILYLAITSAVVSFATILHIAEREGPHWLCVAGAFIDQTASWAGVIAVSCITVNLTLLVLFQINTERLEKLYIAIIFGLPISLNWIPFVNDAYGESGAWCWIRGEDSKCDRWTYGLVLQLVLWYIPLYVLLAIVTIVYVLVLVKLRRDRQKWMGQYDPTATKRQKVMQKEVRPLLLFPLFYLILYFIPFINRIVGVASDEPVLALWILHTLSFSPQGALILLAFLLDPDTFKRLKWPVFKATVIQLWRKDVQEYPISTVQSDSFGHRTRNTESSNTLVRNDAAIEEMDRDARTQATGDSVEH